MADAPHILLVEDSRTQAIQMSGILQSAGWQVTCADSADAAITEIDRQTPSLILIDYYLPRVRGDALCRQIRMRIDTRFIPIVILTGDDDHDIELSGLESGADDFISKSADQEVLLVRLRALLSKAHADKSPARPSDTDFSNARLLAVDDSRTYLAFLVEQLSGEYRCIETASNGAEAIERLRHEDFDCVLVDLVMPDMSGIEVCQQINALRKDADHAEMVLMLTASEDNHSLSQSLEAGADDFVGKSSDTIVIKGRIRALLRRKFYEEEHRRRLSAELRAVEMEAEHERVLREEAQARAALVDDLKKTTEALQRSNEELQRFAYVASHDLQEPLRAVAGYVELLERRYAEKLDEQAHQFIRYAVDGAVRMKTLISDLLAYSRVDTRGAELSPVDTARIVEDVLANLHTAVNESGAQITYDALPTVMGDQTQLRQLFQNLIGNAIKYRGDKSPVIHVGVEQKDDRYTFSISDNGIGIEPQYFERIFVIFQRLHQAGKYPGTGIGLAIAKRIVERHGGSIWLESNPGDGSTFYFTLQAEADVQATDTGGGRDDAGRTVEGTDSTEPRAA